MKPSDTINVTDLIERQPIGLAQSLVFGMLFVTLAIDGLDSQITSYLGPAIAREWGISMSSLGLVFSAGLAGSACGAISIGMLGDMIGRKRTILLAVSLVGLATAAGSFASSAAILVVFRFLTGLGVGGALPNLIALASQLSPQRRRATVITWTGCGFPAGAALAGVLAVQLLPSAGWRVAYQVAGCFPLVLVPVLALLLPESIPKTLAEPNGQSRARALIDRFYPRADTQGELIWIQHQAGPDRSPLAAIFDRGLALRSILIAGLFVLSSMNLYFLASWLPGLLQKQSGNVHESIVATTLFNVGGVFGALVLGQLIDRLGMTISLSTSLSCVVAFMVFLALGHYTSGALLIATAVGGVCANGSQGALNSIPALLYPEALRATAAGWALAIGRVGFVGPLIAGAMLSAHWSTATVLIWAATAPLTAIVVLRILSLQMQGRFALSA